MAPCDLAFAAHLHIVTIHGQRGIAGQRNGTETCVRTFVWHGDGDNTHIGSVHGRGHVKRGILTVDDDDVSDCELQARRVGECLLVIDNRHCGGVNVAFDGVYRRH